MGKSSGLAVLALLLGIGGLGLGAYSYFIFSGQIAAIEVQNDNSSEEIIDLTDQLVNFTYQIGNLTIQRAVVDMRYAKYLEDWKPSVVNTNESVITVNFQVNEDEAAYFLFVSRAIIYGYSFGESYMRFTFSIDGVILNKPYVIAGGRSINEDWLYFPVALQYSAIGLTEGSHSVSVMVLSVHTSNLIRQCSILVQTYI